MGGAGGTPDPQDPSGIGGSRTALEAKAGGALPQWAAGDTVGSWLTKAFPGVQMNDQNVSEATTGTTGTVNAAPEPTTAAALGMRPPEYARGLGNRSEADSRAAVPMTGPGVSGPASAPAGKTAEQLAAEAKAKGEEWVSVQMPDAFHANASNLYAAQQQPGTYNFGGVYAPKGISQTNAPQYSSQGPQQPGALAPGSTLTGADAENQPRMRRALYDFNMSAYGNPYGPGGGSAGAARPWWEAQPGSFFMGGGG